MRTFPMLAAAAFIVSLAFGMSTPATAQTEVAKKAIAKVENALTKVANSCVADIRAFCASVTPGDGRIALCLAAHEDKISNTCYAALLDVSRDIDVAANRLIWTADVCRSDIAKHCKNTPEGQGRIAQCLVNSKAKLSSVCRNEVGAIEARLKK